MTVQKLANAHGVYVLRTGDTLTAYATLGHDYLDETDVTGCDDETVQELAYALTQDNTQEPDND